MYKRFIQCVAKSLLFVDSSLSKCFILRPDSISRIALFQDLMDSFLHFDKGMDKLEREEPKRVFKPRKIVYRDRGFLEGFWKRSIFRHVTGQIPTINTARSLRNKKPTHGRFLRGG